MKIIDCQQNTPEWLAARVGRVTASEIDALISPTGKVRAGKGVDSYLYFKMAEKLLGFPLDDWTSQAADRGSIMEHEARPWYEFDRECIVQKVGFCVSDDGRYGCSPDGLVGEDGGVEIKCFGPQNSIQVLVEGAIPDANIMQVHMSLFVTGRKWWDWVSYSRQWPPMVIRVHRDEKIHAIMQGALTDFADRFDAGLAKVRAMKNADNQAKQAAYDANPEDQNL